MQMKSKMDPDKLDLIGVRILKAELYCPDHFNPEKIKGYTSNTSLQLGFNIEKKTGKAELSIQVTSESKEKNVEEAKCSFLVAFYFKVDNLIELATLEENGFTIDSGLGNALASISYSTARGILITRLQGTGLQEFILPVISPNSLLEKSKDS